MEENILEVPYNFVPRPYQLEALEAFDAGIRRHFWRWHRRAGKDKLAMCMVAREMLRRPGSYYYVFPTYAQGKRALWENADNDSFKLIDHIPKECIKSKNAQELKLELKAEYGGSIFRIVGSDNIDSLRGANPFGLVFSEFAYQSMESWDMLEPIISRNNGWVIFNSTPAGQNHMYELDMKIRKNPRWYYSKKQTLYPDQPNYTGDVTPEEIQLKREEGKEEWFLEQEYGVSYSAATQGSIYFDQIEKAEELGRIGDFPYDSTKWVDTYWDLGRDDNTAIWFRQVQDGKLVFIDYYTCRDKDWTHYVEVLHAKGYRYRTHYLPHDGGHKSLSQLTPAEQFSSHCVQAGISSDVLVCPKFTRKQDGIMAVRGRFGRFFFNEGLCQDGLQKLKLYHRRYDPKKRSFTTEPVHDWCSHAADALMTEASAEELDCDDPYSNYGQQIKVKNDYDIFE